MKSKKEFSALIPYRRAGERIEYYLQKRSTSAKRSPGRVGIFGGEWESGETMESALMREMQEELSYAPLAYVYFSRYETAGGIVHVCVEEVENDFESKVVIGEGENGKFYTVDQLTDLPLSHVAGIAVQEVEEWLRK